MKQKPYAKYLFHGRSGYILQPSPGHENEMIALGHTANLAPWSDPDIHMHTISYEYYFLRRGSLFFLVNELALSLHGPELLALKPGVPHAIIGGEGPIEHFGIRAPGRRDKRVVAALPASYPAFSLEESRQLTFPWGYRIPLSDGRYQNNWCLGVDQALFHSPPMGLAYLNFPTVEAARIDEKRNQRHLHHESWEYYVVLNGRKTIQIAAETVTVTPGEICIISPNTSHQVVHRDAPYLGFTIRAPLKPDKYLC